MANIGFIGIGHMGKPIAQRLVNDGHEMTVYDLEKEKSEQIKGAKIAENPAQTAENNDYLITMLPYSDDTIDVLIGEEGALSAAQPNCVFIDCGTGSPSLSWFLGRRIREDDFEYLDCPLSGSVKTAEEGNLLLSGSGNKQVFDLSEEIFKSFANRIHFIGEENGLGQLTKLTLNTLLGAGMVLFAECVNFGLKAGIDKDKLFEVLKDSNLPSHFMKAKIPYFETGEFGSNFQNYLMDKDLTYINEVAEHVKAYMPLNSASWQLYRTAMSQGLEDQDYSSVFKIVEELSLGEMPERKAA